MQPRTDHSNASQRARPALQVTIGSLILAAIKGLGAWLTGSASLLAAAVDSAGDALMSAGNWFVVKAADQPPDKEHPFGHGKLEHLAGLIQALFIAASGVFVIREAFRTLGGSQDIDHPAVGLGIAALSLVAAWAFARHLARAAREHDSPALKADSLHYGSDLFTHLGVILVFLFDLVTDFPWLDPAVAAIIAAIILHTAWGLLLESVSRLMDSELEGEEVRAVEAAIATFGPPLRGYHDLLTRRSGSDRFVQAHVEIDATVSFREAHELVEQVERAIKTRLPRAHVIIHADPWPENPDDPHKDFARAGTV